MSLNPSVSRGHADLNTVKAPDKPSYEQLGTNAGGDTRAPPTQDFTIDFQKRFVARDWGGNIHTTDDTNPKRRALVIAIAYPLHSAPKPLGGTYSDAYKMTDLLENTFHYDKKEICVLADYPAYDGRDSSLEPSKANIEKGLRWLCNGSQKGDYRFLFYAGHGERRMEKPSSRAYFYEGIVPKDVSPIKYLTACENCDCGFQVPLSTEKNANPQKTDAQSRGPVFDPRSILWDYEINRIIAPLLADGAKLTVVLDCCHSGGTLSKAFKNSVDALSDPNYTGARGVAFSRMGLTKTVPNQPILNGNLLRLPRLDKPEQAVSDILLDPSDEDFPDFETILLDSETSDTRPRAGNGEDEVQSRSISQTAPCYPHRECLPEVYEFKPECRVLCWAACRDSEFAWEKGSGGYFTDLFVEHLKTTDPQQFTYRKLNRKINAEFAKPIPESKGEYQNPQLYTSANMGNGNGQTSPNCHVSRGAKLLFGGMSRSYYSPDGQPSAPDQYQQFAEPTSQATSNHDSGQSGEGYGLVYGDGGFTSSDGATFEERLRTLMRQQGDELRSFADREGRSIDEIRAQAVTLANTSPHEFLYSAAMQPLTPQETITKMDAALEHLHQALGYDGFLAIVTPVDADGDGGITAGTKLGLEFWKGLRGGGLAGLKSLKLRCKANRDASMDMGSGGGRVVSASGSGSGGGVSASRKSLDIKQELNSAMRNALREAAGDPLAEMRWTKPEQLEGYGVRIIGWPSEIALRNPSNNPVRDNKTLLSLLKSGQLRFVKKDSPEWDQADPSALVRSTAQAQSQPQSHPAPQQQQPSIPQLVQPPVQQPPIPRTPSFTSTPPSVSVPPAQQPMHPQIAYVYQVPGGQGWIPLSGVSVYGAPFATAPGPGQMEAGTVNVAQISGGGGGDAGGGKKRRGEGHGGSMGKKRRGNGGVEASG